VRFDPGLTPVCIELQANNAALHALAEGDFNADGTADLAVATPEAIWVYSNQAGAAACASGFWFTVQSFVAPGLAAELAAIDFDQDGILDLVSTQEIWGTVQFFKGLGSGGIGDGTFDVATQLSSADASGLAIADFSANGSPDIAVSQPQCDQAFVIDQPAPTPLPINLTLLTPNGGENWGQGVSIHVPARHTGVHLASGNARSQQGAQCASIGSGDTPRTTSLQQITWSKGAAIQAVDVQVSRDDGATWQTIAPGQPGTSLAWIVTAPGTQHARVRVRDSNVRSRLDGSDGSFVIASGPPTDAPDVAPVVAGFWLRDANPVYTLARFQLATARSGQCTVELFDVRGRMVRRLVRGPVAAGRHEIAWDTRDDHGQPVARGVYFVCARAADLLVERKVVLLRK
jgi:hypothetical protein